MGILLFLNRSGGAPPPDEQTRNPQAWRPRRGLAPTEQMAFHASFPSKEDAIKINATLDLEEPQEKYSPVPARAVGCLENGVTAAIPAGCASQGFPKGQAMSTQPFKGDVEPVAAPGSQASGDSLPPNCRVVEVRLRELRQLFDPMDPTPFRERDLDPKAEEYIVDSVKELPPKATCALMVHLDEPMKLPDEAVVIGHALRVHFTRRARLRRRDLRRLIRRGFASLGIGVAFLIAMFLTGQAVGRLMGETGLASLVRESLIIVGWVAMWRPLEIFLYDWWPILGERRLYDRLSAMKVRVTYDGSPPLGSIPRVVKPGAAPGATLGT
jgi:hypothetical protein